MELPIVIYSLNDSFRCNINIAQSSNLMLKYSVRLSVHVTNQDKAAKVINLGILISIQGGPTKL